MLLQPLLYPQSRHRSRNVRLPPARPNKKAWRRRHIRANQKLGEEGIVALALYLNEEGRVQEAKVETSSGFARLDDAAVKQAVKAWKFEPCTEEGKPVACWYKIKFRFLLKTRISPRLIEPSEGIKQRLFFCGCQGFYAWARPIATHPPRRALMYLSHLKYLLHLNYLSHPRTVFADLAPKCSGLILVVALHLGAGMALLAGLNPKLGAVRVPDFIVKTIVDSPVQYLPPLPPNVDFTPNEVKLTEHIHRGISN